MKKTTFFKQILRYLGLIIYLGILVLGCTPIYMAMVFGKVAPDALLMQFLSPQSGTPFAYYLKYLCFSFLPALIIWLATIYAWKKAKQLTANKQRKAHIAISCVAVILCVLSCYSFESYTGISHYVYSRMHENTLIADYYVPTKEVKLKFPEKKHNLIYIWSESMEASYQDPANGGCMKENLIPELTKLANENYSFSLNDKAGGFIPVQTATYTLGSMVAQMSGLPWITPFREPNDTPPGAFLPGAWNLGDILEKVGYKNVFLSGASAKFGRQENWFLQHGNYEVIDLNTLRETGKVPKDYLKFWGVEDQKLFGFAKEKLTELAKSDQPFNLQLELMDTHGPEGWPTPGYTSDKYPDDKYAEVLVGASKMINEFIDWVKEQPFYKDTTIIIVGDHFTMAPDYHKRYLPNEKPSVYNCIINPLLADMDKSKLKLKNRTAVTMDMFPTTLAALGVEIDGNKLALGTNLFSQEDTLAEQIGLDKLNDAFRQNSNFYNKYFLHPDWLKKPEQ